MQKLVIKRSITSLFLLTSLSSALHPMDTMHSLTLKNCTKTSFDFMKNHIITTSLVFGTTVSILCYKPIQSIMFYWFFEKNKPKSYYISPTMYFQKGKNLELGETHRFRFITIYNNNEFIETININSDDTTTLDHYKKQHQIYIHSLPWYKKLFHN